MLGLKILLLSKTNTVLTAARATHPQGPLDQAVCECPSLRKFFLAGQAQNVEIPVADVTEDDSGKPFAVKISARGHDALSQPGEGNAGIGDDYTGAGPQGASGEVGVVVGFPEAFAVCKVALLFKTGATVRVAEFLGHGCGFRYVSHAHAVKFKEDGGALCETDGGESVDCSNHLFIQKFNARGIDAKLNNLYLPCR